MYAQFGEVLFSPFQSFACRLNLSFEQQRDLRLTISLTF